MEKKYLNVLESVGILLLVTIALVFSLPKITRYYELKNFRELREVNFATGENMYRINTSLKLEESASEYVLSGFCYDTYEASTVGACEHEFAAYYRYLGSNGKYKYIPAKVTRSEIDAEGVPSYAGVTISIKKSKLNMAKHTYQLVVNLLASESNFQGYYFTTDYYLVEGRLNHVNPEIHDVPVLPASLEYLKSDGVQYYTDTIAHPGVYVFSDDKAVYVLVDKGCQYAKDHDAVVRVRFRNEALSQNILVDGNPMDEYYVYRFEIPDGAYESGQVNIIHSEGTDNIRLFML